MCYLDSWKIDPQIVCVENVELFDRLEILDVVLGNLGYFQQSQMILKLKSFGLGLFINYVITFWQFLDPLP